MAAPAIYPGWTLRFFVDETIPWEIRNALLELGAEIQNESSGQSSRQRLTWRFKVANDQGVGRFLVRDVDSVISFREKSAVDEWIASDRWFHVMRDWWTHTDLILAGMWGGVAGVLPSLLDIFDTYQPRAMETPNVDQWFLRDKVWAYVRSSCLVHDRCFRPQGAQPWPEQEPDGNTHVGQNAFGARREEQEKRLANLATTPEKSFLLWSDLVCVHTPLGALLSCQLRYWVGPGAWRSRTLHHDLSV